MSTITKMIRSIRVHNELPYNTHLSLLQKIKYKEFVDKDEAILISTDFKKNYDVAYTKNIERDSMTKTYGLNKHNKKEGKEEVKFSSSDIMSHYYKNGMLHGPAKSKTEKSECYSSYTNGKLSGTYISIRHAEKCEPEDIVMQLFEDDKCGPVSVEFHEDYVQVKVALERNKTHYYGYNYANGLSFEFEKEKGYVTRVNRMLDKNGTDLILYGENTTVYKPCFVNLFGINFPVIAQMKIDPTTDCVTPFMSNESRVKSVYVTKFLNHDGRPLRSPLSLITKAESIDKATGEKLIYKIGQKTESSRVNLDFHEMYGSGIGVYKHLADCIRWSNEKDQRNKLIWRDFYYLQKAPQSYHKN